MHLAVCRCFNLRWVDLLWDLEQALWYSCQYAVSLSVRWEYSLSNPQCWREKKVAVRQFDNVKHYEVHRLIIICFIITFLFFPDKTGIEWEEETLKVFLGVELEKWTCRSLIGTQFSLISAPCVSPHCAWKSFWWLTYPIVKNSSHYLQFTFEPLSPRL